MAIVNKNQLKSQSSNTYINNTVGAITPANVRQFNDDLIDSLVDELDYAIDSASWNSNISNIYNVLNVINLNTSSFVTNSQTASMSVATASYVDLRGDNITVKYFNNHIELSGSQGSAKVIVDDQVPSIVGLQTGSLWYNSLQTSMYVLYDDGVTTQWVGISSVSPATASWAENALTASYFITSSVTSASLAQTASYVKNAQTASYFITSSVTNATTASLAVTALNFFTQSVTNAFFAQTASTAQYINVTGSGVQVYWNGSELQLTASAVITSSNASTASLAINALNANTASLALTASYFITSSVTSASLARTASYFFTSSVTNATTASLALQARTASLSINSLNAVTASHALTASLTISSSVAISASYAPEQDTLQSVTTRGNSTSRSIDIRDQTNTNTTGLVTLTQGFSVQATGNYSHAQGFDTTAQGIYSHAEGSSTNAIGQAAHAEGVNTVAQGNYSHAEGAGSTAQGVSSHAEGDGNIAIGEGSHAEGTGTSAQGRYSHTEGDQTQAIGEASHAEGVETIAQGIGSHVAGYRNDAAADYQAVVGQYNLPLASTADRSAFIVGDGNGILGDPKELHNLLYAGNGKVVISGSLAVTGPITASIASASYALSASMAQYSKTALTASYFITSSVTYATSASHAEFSETSSLALGALVANTALNFFTASVTSASLAQQAISASATYYAQSSSLALTASYFITSSVTSASLARTASYINVTGSNIIPRWFGSQLQLTGSKGTAMVTISDTAPTGSAQDTGSLWYNSTNGVMYVYYVDPTGSQWVSVTIAGPVASASLAQTASLANTASYALNAATASIANYIAITGSNIFHKWSGSLLQITASLPPISGSVGTLQMVTTLGNHTSTSVHISNSFTNGRDNVALGDWSHAQGYGTLSDGLYSHAEGQNTKAQGVFSHAEGEGTLAEGVGSHAEGNDTWAEGVYSHTAGRSTIAAGNYQSVIGVYNRPLDDNGAFIIGDGTGILGDPNYRHNLLVAKDGAIEISGSLNISSSITAPIFYGTASVALTTVTSITSSISASYALTASYISGAIFQTSSVTSASLAQTASYVNITGSGVKVNYNGSQIQLTASADATIYISDTAPTSSIDTGSLWFNSLNTSMYVYYNDGVQSQWVGISSATPVQTASFAFTASYFITSSVTSASIAQTASYFSGSIANAISASTALTASYFITSSVTSASLAQTASYFITSSVTSASLSQTASYVSGAITNIGDSYSSVAPALRIITLTSAEYAAIVTKDPNTFYAVV